MQAKSIAYWLLAVPALMQAQPQLLDTCVHLNEIVVTAPTGTVRLSESPTPVTVIGASQLGTMQSGNLIDAIALQPGVSQVTTGGGISKPVIRGLGYNRVLVVDQGVRQEGQQWGDEHGIEIDANRVGSVEIQKGPATLMWGSDAMAGVLIMHDAPLMARDTHKATVTGEYQTNQGLWAYSVDAAGNHRGWTYDWRWSQKAAHDYKNAADGYVPGSRLAERALSGMVGTSGQWGYSRVNLSYYHLTPGIVEGERDDEGELERPDNGKHYGKTLPFQQVHHYKAVSNSSFRLGSDGGVLRATLGYQQNRRQEFEDDPDKAGLDFKLHTVNYDLRWVAPGWGGLRLNAGVGGMAQRSLNLGDEYLIPSYSLVDLGVFATGNYSLLADNLHLAGGVRFDTRRLHSHALSTDGGEQRFERFHRNFQGVTGSLGAVLNVSRHLDVRINVSRGYRAPNLSELGSNGEHEGTLRYELGNSRLSPEFSWQWDAGLEFGSEPVSAQLSLFLNDVDNFIYLHRLEGQVAGDEQLPVYGYTQGHARLVGGEATVVVHPLRHLHWENALSVVSSRLLHQPAGARHLPFTPAPRWTSSLHYDLPAFARWLQGAYVTADMEHTMRQSHVHTAGGTETVTPGYWLFGGALGADVVLRGRKLLSVTLTAKNIFDRSYYSHLSRLKTAGIHNQGRNWGVKVAVPIGW